MLLRPSFIALLFVLFIGEINAQINFPSGSSFRFLKSNEAGSLSSSWSNDGFNDASWGEGSAPFHYGDGTGGTLLDDMRYNYHSLYLRAHFNAINANLISEINFSINYDDGFIIYINGQEVLNVNAPAIPNYNSLAPNNHESGSFENFSAKLPSGLLKEGDNTIAVHGFNVNLESSDFYYDMNMSAITLIPEFPDSLGISCSSPSGFYSSPFNLTISYPDPDVKIYYTLDGTNPQDLISGMEISSGASIYIDPASNVLRALTPVVTLRVSVFKDGFKPSKPTARSYIFLENVKTQSYPGGDWPNTTVNDQAIDLPMDSRIINHSSYRDLIDNAFMEIPSISIITDLKNLFDPTSGIYVNAMEHGVEWERECSVELIDPKGNPGFNVNAGLRIRGGWSRHGYFPKHAFRLLFKDEFGDGKLYFPLFGEEGVDHFDNVDLRTAQNYAWSNGDPNNTMVREVFSRDLQRDMNHPYTRSRYYHLYLDGMYWGLFQTQERSEASFGSDYFGGEEENYDVIKISTDLGYIVEATDGNTDAWKKIYNMSLQGFSDNTRYFSLLGCDANGNKIPGAETLIEIDNFIDYMIGIFYTGNFDAPVSAFSNNKNPNNFYCILNREYKAEGFRFFNHDAEHALFDEAHGPGTGLYEDRVNLGTRADDKKMIVTSFDKFQPQWLHFKLTENAEYRKRFVDRAWLQLSAGGSLSPEKCLERFNLRADQIDTAIIAESARWGDARRDGSGPYTRNSNWIPELNKVRNNYFPVRTDIVIDQLLQAGLFTLIDPPFYSINSQLIGGIIYSFENSVTLKILNSESSADIYYTLDGSDPRLIGSKINTTAKKISALTFDISINHSCIVKARTYKSGIWSALREMHFLKQDEDYSGLKITEMNFFPSDKIEGVDTLYGKMFEFIEFKNISDYGINLSGLKIDSAVEYKFPENTILGAGEFYVIVSKPTTFYNTYGLKPSGNYKGFLENYGEEFLLTDKGGNKIFNFHYTNEYPWPTSASGSGKSLVSTEINPTGNPADGWYWTSSKEIGGSPFSDEPNSNAISRKTTLQPEISIFPNPAQNYINLQFRNIPEPFQADVRIFGIGGNLIYQTKANQDRILNLSKSMFTSGIYILEIKTKDIAQSFRLIVK